MHNIENCIVIFFFFLNKRKRKGERKREREWDGENELILGAIYKTLDCFAIIYTACEM